MPIDRGELVDREVETFKQFGKVWRLTVNVFFTGNHYNVSVSLEKKAFFSSDEWEKTVKAPDKNSIENTAEEVTEELLDLAKERLDAREVELDISIDQT